jgi:uncharacterized membrane protein
MKLFGHPLHIMLIHFPSALFPMDLVCSVLALYYGSGLSLASFYAMIGGTVLGALAIVTGALDLIPISNRRPELVKKILLHGGINSLVVIVYSLLAYLAYTKFPHITPDGWPLIITKACLVLFMIGGNYIGGSLILKDKAIDE